MTPSVSPYVLLKSSKPKPPNAFISPYDLYSAALAAAAQQQSAPQADNRSGADDVWQSAPPPQPQKQTHYISEIQKRHSRALKTANISASAPMLSHSPSFSVQQPPT